MIRRGFSYIGGRRRFLRRGQIVRAEASQPLGQPLAKIPIGKSVDSRTRGILTRGQRIDVAPAPPLDSFSVNRCERRRDSRRASLRSEFGLPPARVKSPGQGNRSGRGK